MATKTDGATSVAAGGTLTYTIVVTNAGSTTVTGAAVVDIFSPQFSSVIFTTAQTGGATGFSNSPASGFNNINQTLTMPAGSTVTYTVTAVLSPTATGAVSNLGSVNAPAGVTDTNATNNVAVDTDIITPTAPPQTDLSITKNNGINEVTAGGMTTYVIVVSNNSTTNVTGA